MLHRVKNKKGFTLIEVMVVMFILSLVLYQLFAVLDASYANLDKEMDKQEKRENFRVFTSFMFRDLVQTPSYEVKNYTNYDVLTYEKSDGQIQTIILRDNDGIYRIVNNSGKEELLAEGKRFEPSMKMIEDDNGLIRFNFIAEDVNVLLLTNVSPRATY